MSEIDINELLKNTIQWSYETGKIHLQYFRSGLDLLGISTKSTCTDLVTKVDVLSEQYLCKKIFEKYPNHRILSEEGGFIYSDSYKQEKESDHYYMWVIDPLDGTVNYAHGLPIFAVSIGIQRVDISTPELKEKDKQRLTKGKVYHPMDPKNTLCSVVYAPYINELFYGKRNGGSYMARLNSQNLIEDKIQFKTLYETALKMKVSPEASLEKSLLSSGFPYDKNTNPDNNLKEFSKILVKTRGFRREGCSAYDQCMVAAGILNTYYEIDIKAWDCCGAILLVEEAGGVWKYIRDDRNYSIVVGNSNIVSQVCETITVNK